MYRVRYSSSYIKSQLSAQQAVSALYTVFCNYDSQFIFYLKTLLYHHKPHYFCPILHKSTFFPPPTVNCSLLQQS